ncbi:hypothetical protein Q7P35_003703 [Cladosporium inversicolor]
MSEFKFPPGPPSLRLPAARRISLPASQRLSTITEGAQAPEPGRWSRLSNIRNSTSSAATYRTAPPPYTSRPGSVAGDGSAPHAGEEEKLARLRKTWSGTTGTRGGWGRLVILAVAIVVVVGLAVGLGVGLTVGRKNGHESENTTTSNSGDTQQPTLIQQLPLGQYSFATTLRDQQTNCSSNPATWRCYPYTVFNPSDSSTQTSSLSTFDWIIRNTSAIYATNTTPNTPTSGVSANLTISSTNNPFALAFTAQDLTYHADTNATSPRLTFAFALPKIVVPTSALTSNNVVTQCYFNNTILSGTIYLEGSLDSSANSTGSSSYQDWPYAVEVIQSSPSGEGTPDCYETVDGKLGARVEGLEPEAEGDECRCEYRNYG